MIGRKSTFGQYLQSLRLDRRLTQAALAKAVGLKGNALISRIERGTAFPSPELRRRMAVTFAVEEIVLRDLAERDMGGARERQLLEDLADEHVGLRNRLQVSVDEIAGELEQHRQRIAAMLRASRLQLVWSLEQKIAFEGRARNVWVVTPDLNLELNVAAVRELVRANLARGVKYRYLIPDSLTLRRRARALFELAPRSELLQVRQLKPMFFDFAIETVLYDAEDRKSRLGLMIAPSERADIDCVLSRAHLERMARSFERRWLRARPVA
ncbi:MAG: helix-turn-helix domain-containing protein [Myxococcota bacterium]